MSKIRANYICEQTSPFQKTKRNIGENNSAKENFSIKEVEKKLNPYEKFLNQKKSKIKVFNKDGCDEEILSFKNTVENVFENLIFEKNKTKNLLLMGQIQSGKTDFVMCLISKIITENASRIMLFLTSANVNLVNQNKTRLKNSFEDKDLEIYDYNHLKDFAENSNDFNYFQNTLSEKNKKYVFCLQKQKDHLEKFKSLIKKINQENIDLESIIVFDDEADVYSLGNLKAEKATINKSIVDILSLSKIYGTTYISITATVFAHVLLSDESELKPEKAFYLKPAKSYLSLHWFVDEINSQKSNTVLKINDQMNSKESLKVAILNFILSIHLFRKKENYKDVYPRMLINVDRITETHFSLKKELIHLIESWKNNKEFYLKEIDSYEILKKYLQSFSISKRKSLEKEIKTNMFFLLERLNINVVNGESSDKPELDTSNTDWAEIIIGSDKLGRGLTLKDLTVSYYMRRSDEPLMDTTLQAARWLGYREDYKELIKVYLTEKIIKDFIEIEFSLNDLINKVKYSEKNDLHFGDCIYDIEKLNLYNITSPTRNSVAEFEINNKEWRTDVYCPIFESNGESKSEKNKNIDKANLEFFERFRNYFKSNEKRDKHNYPIIEFKKIKEFLNKFAIYESNSKKELSNLFGNDLVFGALKNYFEDEITIRLISETDINSIEWKERMLNECNENEKIFGIGTYKGDHDFFEFKKFYIDIIPIKCWSEKIEGKIFRTRIFFPSEKRKNSAFVKK